MNKNLDHLPASRRKHLAHIVAVLRDELEQITDFSTGEKKHSRILKIILFGSHATRKWVNDPARGYVSDYDILVIVNHNKLLEDYKLWDRAEDRIELQVRPPLNLLIHTLDEVNDALIKGQYFFSDIKREGIVLYETDQRELAEAGNLSSGEYKAIAEKNYDQWFDSANGFLKQYKYAAKDKELKIAAFELHQATERFYSCLLLVLTSYKPNTHNLKLLNSLTISQDERITAVFPQDKKMYRRRFQLLKQAYVDARYSEYYKITEEELLWLAERVQVLQDLTKKLCQEKIASFE